MTDNVLLWIRAYKQQKGDKLVKICPRFFKEETITACYKCEHLAKPPAEYIDGRFGINCKLTDKRKWRKLRK